MAHWFMPENPRVAQSSASAAPRISMQNKVPAAQFAAKQLLLLLFLLLLIVGEFFKQAAFSDCVVLVQEFAKVMELLIVKRFEI